MENRNDSAAVIPLASKQRQFNVRYIALVYDMIQWAYDSGKYDEELMEHALHRIEWYSKQTLRPENDRLVAAHRKQDPESYY